MWKRRKRHSRIVILIIVVVNEILPVELKINPSLSEYEK